MKCTVDDGVRSQPLDGPLSAHIIGFAKWLRDEGYALYTRHREVGSQRRLAVGSDVRASASTALPLHRPHGGSFFP